MSDFFVSQTNIDLGRLKHTNLPRKFRRCLHVSLRVMGSSSSSGSWIVYLLLRLWALFRLTFSFSVQPRWMRKQYLWTITEPTASHRIPNMPIIPKRTPSGNSVIGLLSVTIDVKRHVTQKKKESQRLWNTVSLAIIMRNRGIVARSDPMINRICHNLRGSSRPCDRASQ